MLKNNSLDDLGKVLGRVLLCQRLIPNKNAKETKFWVVIEKVDILKSSDKIRRVN